MIKVSKLTILSFFLNLLFYNSFSQKRPNIIWIYAEDTSPWMGCYGDEINKGFTPNIDSIANSGVRFNRAYVTAPVCSASRSAIIVGQSAIRFGGHQHRSSRTKNTRIYLPENYKLLPEIMQDNGYTTFNHGKNDYNFYYDMKKVYNHKSKSKTDFKDLVSKQPFFGQIQTKGGKNNTDNLSNDLKVNPNLVEVPKDYPNNDIFKKVVAQHYDAIRMDDSLIGEILIGLRKAGLEKNTIIVYFSDHGANNLLRHKQMTTEGGLKVPFAILGPKEYVPKNNIRNDLVCMLDLSATTLSWAGINIPDWYEGQNLFLENYQARKFVGGHRDRLDHSIDKVRTICSDKYRYIKNYKLDRILLQPQYRDKKYFTKNIHDLYQKNSLSNLHKQIYFGERPSEEFYDILKDPEMINNLLLDPKYANEIQYHRDLLNKWISFGDYGESLETVYSLKNNGENRPWGEGVNPEYEVYRNDKDGDGLSDKWEKLNNRDPKDSLLFFDFNCGGWQTEGWQLKNSSSNLAGFLGYLDFDLENSSALIERKDLQIRSNQKDKSLVIRLRASSEINIQPYINEKKLKKISILNNKEFKVFEWELKKPVWQGDIKNLSFTFSGQKRANVEIDYIKVKRR